ncbi:MAG: trypsin-like peptidase domain-containing protein [Candidatus Latescibacterota bacterium]|nr:trypsin-like peptidase domain-containing protein [Candidatus Latescibacterota bacterium]
MSRLPLVLFCVLTLWVSVCRAQTESGPRAGQTQTTAVAQLEALSDAFRAVHEEATPAVVLIQTTGDWDRIMPRFHPRIDPPEDGEAPTGMGSGVIISEDGYILSNHHVVKDADTIGVVFRDRRRLPAQVVGIDSLIDIALLKVNATGLPVARLGESSHLRIGDWVVAIGHPLGMGTTLTHGIVSALGRDANVIGGRSGIESFIQTNAVINPGNSGGPLLDLQGRVIDINTAISTRTGYYIGYGLAVPIDLAREAVDDLLTHGRIVRGYLGIEMTAVDDARVRELQLGLDPPRGVLVTAVLPGTAAEIGGLDSNDVILSVDGEIVNVPNQVQTRIYNRDPGETIELVLFREGLERHVLVTLGEREDDQRLARGEHRLDALGITVATVGERASALGLSESVAEQLGLQDQRQAVVIIEVDPRGPAAAKGLNVDDIITEIDNQKIGSVDVFVRSVADLRRGESALFWLWHQDRGIDVRALRMGGRRE